MKEYEISILPYQDFTSREYYLMRKYFTKWYMNILQKMVNKKHEESIFDVKEINKYHSLFPTL